MTKILILNGPPRCGKDTAADAITEMFDAEHIKLSKPLKDFAHYVIGGDLEVLEQNKEKNLPIYNMSYREMQIFLFQAIAKGLGEQWLGKITARNIRNSENDLFVMSDGGRPEDLEPLFRAFPSGSIMIVQIMREGCFFNNDIRQYISDRRAKMRHTVNKDKDAYIAEMKHFAAEFFED